MDTSPAAFTERGQRARGVPAPRSPSLILLMLLAVAAVSALALWDEKRESSTTLDDFAQEQATLASSVASELSTRLAGARRDGLIIAEGIEEGRRVPVAVIDGYSGYRLGPADAAPLDAGPSGITLRVPTPGGQLVDLVVPPVKLLEGAARIERPGSALVLILGPTGDQLHGTDGRVIRSEPIHKAFVEGQSSVWLGRAAAAAMGLPERRAAVGLARVDAGSLGRWGIAVVSSAERERDRESRARWRLVLGLGVAVGLVFAFGTIALRKQRRELVLEHELAVTALQRERDARLASTSKVAMMGTLAMGIAHEFSTPLGVIAGRAEQLAPRVSGDERSSRSVRAILEQTERIRVVIRGFLDLARGGAPTLDDVPPDVVLRSAVALVEHRFASAGVALSVHRAQNLPAIHCDAPMLEQALVNLLLNACDACSRDGNVEAKIDSDGERVAFTVIDDGVGITLEDATRATEPFFTTKPAGQGTGIGLAIANEIVKLHRGTLSLRPVSPRGTSASVVIPVPRAQSHAAA